MCSMRILTKKPPGGSQVLIGAPLERLELSLPAPEADALSTELQGRVKKFYHTRQIEILICLFRCSLFSMG